MDSRQTEQDSPALVAATTTANMTLHPIVVLIVASLLVSACNETTEVVRSSDIYVIDGDVDGQRYRLVGYDTPETYRSNPENSKWKR